VEVTYIYVSSSHVFGVDMFEFVAGGEVAIGMLIATVLHNNNNRQPTYCYFTITVATYLKQQAVYSLLHRLPTPEYSDVL
jgi:hypothetical protein